jgi:Fe-S-cluster containining protein
MSQPEPLCASCARLGKTCCQGREIYATLGDVERIAAHTGRRDFVEFLAPDDPEYQDQDDDPTWTQFVFQADGTRRVLRRQANGDCTFLGPQGCQLSLEVRPLVCRLNPYEYHEGGLYDEPGDVCPVHLLKPGQTLFEAIGMNDDDVRRWHRQLYAEIRLEKDSC